MMIWMLVKAALTLILVVAIISIVGRGFKYLLPNSPILSRGKDFQDRHIFYIDHNTKLIRLKYADNIYLVLSHKNHSLLLDKISDISNVDRF